MVPSRLGKAQGGGWGCWQHPEALTQVLEEEKMGRGVAICRSPHSQALGVPGVNVSPCPECPLGSRHPAYQDSPPEASV